ncbi:hypothetical protein F9B85_07170 [Heliorestis acidaminivorans]|uniref:Nucleotidyltransferase n=1 Tax=Heliorestis acidaminivorans TaxID=553427 RepID=A0A6I0F360_9FIRM|nr:nucleotidyltransferase domain-containing protein [Heliorestis acidaminivorans]KAB2953036.1 hypothetical protein F9B85_07170 [Heliorestis acidaminivorans]
MIHHFNSRQVALAALVGSHNYNLNTATSDEDWKYLILPTFDDLYDGIYYAHACNSPSQDFTVHDLRRFCQLLCKGNPYFLEILFSIKVYATEHHDDFRKQLIMQREKLASMNRPALFRACLGHSKEKMKNLRKGTATTKALVLQKGYDTKEALHAYRLLDLLERYESYEWNFAKALWYKEEEQAPLRALKNGDLQHKEIDKYLQQKLQSIEPLAKIYQSLPVDQETQSWLEERVRQEVRLSFFH